MGGMIETVRETILNYHMIRKNDMVLVGVSGGPDSVALLDLLNTLTSEYSIHIGIAHLNHGLRGRESDRDEHFVRSLAQNLGFPFYFEKINIRDYRNRRKMSIEEAGRHARYRFFHELAQRHGYNKIALGHHGDDNAELVLMNLLRGSGTLGLSGMPPIRDGYLIRPLIFCTRAEIVEYIRKREIKYVTDRSNMDNRFTRNKIRNQLIPFLRKTFNPEIGKHLRQFVEIIRTEEEWMDDLVKHLFHDLVVRSGPEHIILSASILRERRLAEQRRLFRHALKAVKGDLRRISFGHIESMVKLLSSQKAGGHLDLPGGMKVEYIKDGISIHRERIGREKQVQTPPVPVPYRYTVRKPDRNGSILRVPESGIRIQLTFVEPGQISLYEESTATRVFFDMDRLSFPLVLRNIEPGDRFKPFGMAGSQKVKKFFINTKVPMDARKKCPVLLDNDDIIWLVGYRRGEKAKVTPDTENILKIERLLA